MTNYEHYREQIEKLVRMGLRVAVKSDTNEIVACGYKNCESCLFRVDRPKETCVAKSVKWADAEYVAPGVDWTKVAVDTPILVSDDGQGWRHRHFAKYEKGKVYAWNDGRTSFTSDNVMSWWSYAKLAEGEQG